MIQLGNLHEKTLYNLKTDVEQTENVNLKEKKKLNKIGKRFFEIVDGFYKSDIQ